MAEFVAAIDAGTTGITVLLLDRRRRVVGRAYRELGQSYPRPGWVEQDPLEIWQATRLTLKAALRAAGKLPGQLAAIGITNQRETTVLWDRKTLRPAAPAIVWQDRRTAARCRDLQPQWQDTVRARTGLVLDPYFSATKIEWLLTKAPGAASRRARAQDGRLAFGTVDSWLLANFTGRHATDPTNASRTLLWDLKAGAWDAELMQLFGVPATLLPEVLPSSGEFGHTTVLGGSIPVTALVGDQQSALFGQHCVAAGQAKSTFGTGCFLLQHTGGRPVASSHGLLTTRAASPDRRAQFALEGSVFTAGAAIQWLRDQLGLIAKASDIDRLANQVPDSAGVHIVPAFTGLGAPYWDPESRGAILGLTRGADKRHLARAVLESIAFQSSEVLFAMEKDSGVRIPELRVDGGAAKSGPLLQAQADFLQRPVVRPRVVDTTALGAGMLAGLAVDQWDLEDLRSGSEQETKVRPRMHAAEADRRLAQWRHAVAATRAFRP